MLADGSAFAVRAVALDTLLHAYNTVDGAPAASPAVLATAPLTVLAFEKYAGRLNGGSPAVRRLAPAPLLPMRANAAISSWRYRPHFQFLPRPPAGERQTK